MLVLERQSFFYYIKVLTINEPLKRKLMNFSIQIYCRADKCWQAQCFLSSCSQPHAQRPQMRGTLLPLHPFMFPSVTNSSAQFVGDSSLARADTCLPAWVRKEDLGGRGPPPLTIALYMVSVNELTALVSKPFMSPLQDKCGLLLSLLFM